MGGHVGGAEASAIAVRAVWQSMLEQQGRPVHAALKRAIEAANEKIYSEARQYRQFMGMGTTVVAVALEGNVAHIAHVGDSRLYAVREKESHLLTRDHTMVNLFVEAELLSPEDAAAHPEAHVLARSLGVEPSVEVDLQDPLELEEGDILLLCSDGVHGPLEDSEFGESHWGDIQRASDRLLDLVRREGGDDNATIVAIGVDIDSPPVPPTPPPDPVDLEQRALDAEVDKDAALARRARDEPKPPMLYDEHHAVAAEGEGAVAAESLYVDEVKEAPVDHHEPQRPVEIGLDGVSEIESDDGGGAGAFSETRAVAGRGRLVAVGALVLLVGAGVAASLSMLDSGVPRILPEATLEVLTPEGAVHAPEHVDAGTANDAVAEAEVTTPQDWTFRPNNPGTPRYQSHRPSGDYNALPPSGPLTRDVIQSSRDGRCAQALSGVQRAMETSVDYAKHYVEVWRECFDKVHYEPLAGATARSMTEFESLVPHFQGSPSANPDMASIPQWYRPAEDGIEFRLEAYIDSTDDDQFQVAILDLLGPENVADQLMRDLTLEVEAAASLAGLSELPPEQQQWLGRRIHQTVRTLNSPAGELIREHRPEAAEGITAALDAITDGAYSDPELRGDLDPFLKEVIEVALGEAPPPHEKVVRRVRPAPKPEPKDTDDETVNIIRSGPN
jgi:protein phosphatase